MKIYLPFYPDPANNCFKTPDPWDCHGSIYDKLLKFKLCYHGSYIIGVKLSCPLLQVTIVLFKIF